MHLLERFHQKYQKGCQSFFLVLEEATLVGEKSVRIISLGDAGTHGSFVATLKIDINQ